MIKDGIGYMKIPPMKGCNGCTSKRKRIEELEAGIKAIAPWLSASLTDHEHDGKGDYLKACNEIFKLDQRKNESNTP